MDSRKIVDLLRGTIDPNLRVAAEEQLKQVTAKFGRKYIVHATLHTFYSRPPSGKGSEGQ